MPRIKQMHGLYSWKYTTCINQKFVYHEGSHKLTEVNDGEYFKYTKSARTVLQALGNWRDELTGNDPNTWTFEGENRQHIICINSFKNDYSI